MKLFISSCNYTTTGAQINLIFQWAGQWWEIRRRGRMIRVYKRPAPTNPIIPMRQVMKMLKGFTQAKLLRMGQGQINSGEYYKLLH